MKISIILPIYQNSKSLIKLTEKIKKTISKIKIFDYEIIMVDDGSTDNSWLKIKEIVDSSMGHIKGIKLSKNFGQFAANTAGFESAKGDYIVNLSADLQDPPELIEQIINILQKKDADVVICARNKNEDSILRRIFGSIHYKILRFSVKNYPLGGFDYWGMNKKAFNAFMSYNDVNRRNQTDILSIGFKQKIITYSRKARENTRSTYNFYKLFNISLNLILSNSKWPLRFVLYIGLITLFFSIMLSIYILINFKTNTAAVNGWTSLTLIVIFYGSICSIALGLIGEYVNMIYSETRNRPLKFIDETYPN